MVGRFIDSASSCWHLILGRLSVVAALKNLSIVLNVEQNGHSVQFGGLSSCA